MERLVLEMALVTCRAGRKTLLTHSLACYPVLRHRSDRTQLQRAFVQRHQLHHVVRRTSDRDDDRLHPHRSGTVEVVKHHRHH